MNSDLGREFLAAAGVLTAPTPRILFRSPDSRNLFSKKAAALKTFKKKLETNEDRPLITYSAVTGEGKREAWSLIDRCIAAASRHPTHEPE